MAVSFCIKEPLDFIRVPQIEKRFSKFPGGEPPIPPPPMGWGNPFPYLPPHRLCRQQKFAPSLACSISKTTGRKKFLATTLHIFNYHI